MHKGQVSIDLLFAVILFLVLVGFLLSYVNDFVNVSEEYQSNVSGFNYYIKAYDFVKSADLSDFNYTIFFDKNIVFNSKQIILDQNNNYIIGVINTNCLENRCGNS